MQKSKIISFLLLYAIAWLFWCCDKSFEENDAFEEVVLDTIPQNGIYLTCSVATEKKEIRINPWYSSEDSVLYYFLPSFASVNNVYLCSDSLVFILNNNVLSKPSTLSDLGIDSFETDCLSLQLKGGNGSRMNFKLVKSNNIPSLFFETASGALTNIHADKNYTENINFLLIDKFWGVDFFLVDTTATLKGRGHGTWGAAKKPYLLKLPHKESLLGLRKNKKWVLLANAYDETNMRNWIALKMAHDAGLYNTPQFVFLDVFANGDYLGLYLMTEKVTEKLVSKGEKEPVLVKIDDSSNGENVFFTERGTQLEIENVGEGDYSLFEVKQVLNQFENVLFSGCWDKSVDIESWARKYLVDEITENGDAGARSNYFYYFPGDMYFYGGPVWDYDLSLGRNKYVCGNPRTYTAIREWRSPNGWTPYYSILMSNKGFKDKVRDLFSNTFLPILNRMIQYEILDKEKDLSSATRMNHIRWSSLFSRVKENHHPVVCTTDELIHFLEERVIFLKSAFIEGHCYHLVQLTYNYGMNGQFMCYSVEHGFPFISFNSLDDPEFSSYHWVDIKTGDDFDPSQIVTSDRQFVLKEAN